MPIIKNTSSKYVSIPNETAQNLDISIPALGALTRLTSYSDNFEFKVEWLQKSWGMGRDKIRGILSELRRHGFMKFVARHTTDGGFDGQEWYISTEPIYRPPENPSHGKTVPLENRPPENPEDNKKDEINKKNGSKEKKIREKEGAPGNFVSSVRNIPISNSAPISDDLALAVMSAAGYNSGFPGANLPDWIREIDFIRQEGYSPADVEAMSRWRKGRLKGILTAGNLAGTMTNWKQNKDEEFQPYANGNGSARNSSTAERGQSPEGGVRGGEATRETARRIGATPKSD